MRKMSGNNPFVAYGVINDGGPGPESGAGMGRTCRHGKLMRPPSNPTAATTPSWRRSSRRRKRLPPTATKMIDDFRLWGVKAVESDQRATQKSPGGAQGWRVTSPPQTLFSQRAEPLAVVVESFPVASSRHRSVVHGRGERRGVVEGAQGRVLPRSGGFEGAGAPRQPQCMTLGRLAPLYYALRRRPPLSPPRSAPAGQVAGPVIHEPPPLEQVRARIGCLDRVADHMRQGRLNDFTPAGLHAWGLSGVSV